MSTAESSTGKSPALALRSNARGQLAMLIAQILFGMAVNLIGSPSEAGGAGKIATSIFLGLHVLVAIGLIVGAIRAIPQAAKIGASERNLAWISGVVVLITFAAGVLTLTSGSNWWSYLMAAGASATIVTYGILYVRTLK
jgi:hypothetical protein